jgi:hypothetical protein
MHEKTKKDTEGNDCTIFHGIFLERLDNTTDSLRTVYAQDRY